MSHEGFSKFERGLALLAGVFNAVIGFIFFFLPELSELQRAVWPVDISPVLARFIGAIILGNAAGAVWLSGEREWAHVRPLALVATVYGTLVALALLYHLLLLKAPSFFWFYFLFDIPFLLVFYGLFIYHDIAPRLTRQKTEPVKRRYIGE